MAKGRTILLGGIAILAVAAGAVAVRTATFEPRDIADGKDVTLAPAPPFDLDAAVQHLSAAAQIPTISHQDPADNQIAEWDRLHSWHTATSPAHPQAKTPNLLPNPPPPTHWQ